ncbi:MAG TPA: alpha-glucan family phosphorylase [Bryobacteraceae bacterium]|jgi:starch phosphorylase|nr:alpha-glucan family phosphorylase [Bryobacteraceae bacterium]
MPFNIQPIQEFVVRPALPPQLKRMTELAYNILWAWEPTIRTLFRRLDPALWKESSYNPVVMLGRVAQSTLDRAASDVRYLAQYKLACQRFDAQMAVGPVAGNKLIAYFSAEYGLTECMPVYSGGLGVLSGDHMKSASDLDLPLVGVGLLYQLGYFRQYLNADGWQQERYLENDFYSLPVRRATGPDGKHVTVSVQLPSGPVAIRVWTMDVGRVKLLFLDTNTHQNIRPEDRSIASQLYGGDNDTRIRQEIVLGIGGMRALEAMGYKPTVFHMNEGHSAFLAIERIRLFIERQGLTFEEALEATRVNNVFTTHTPVPAGIDLFDPGLVYHYFRQYCQDATVGFEQFMALGRRNPQDGAEPLSMAILALNASAYRNGVSRLHGKVSQEMWHSLWPSLPAEEIPITSITNGVHLPSWLNGDLADLYDQYLEPEWRNRWSDSAVWAQIDEIPDEELLEMHRRRKRRLIAFIRDRQTASAYRRKAAAAEIRHSAEVLDPHALTIGFARRFATYKRATLLFRDVERLKKILCDRERPVQIVIAGKAHPKDQPGKAFIREIVQLSRDTDLWKHIVFVEDYDMKVARELVQGVDLWLNTPRRGEEACGTSGMKAAMNGVLNLSVLDGWFDEAYESSGGWAIGDREEYSEDQDAIHASNIYYLLEREIVPLFYAQSQGGGTSEWVRRMKESMVNLTPNFDARRMVHDYTRRLYDPAHANWERFSARDFEDARVRARWNSRVREIWPQVDFLDLGPAPTGPVTSGNGIAVQAKLRLGGLRPEDVRVECVIGRIGVSGGLEETEVVTLPNSRMDSDIGTFEREIVPAQTGRLGYAVRVSANHYEDPLTRPVTSLIKWSNR